VDALTRLSLRFPKAAAATLIAVTLGLGTGLLRLETEVGYRAFLGAAHPSVVAFDGFLERFGGGLPLVAVWSCSETPRCESVFDPAALEMAAAVSRSLAGEPWVRRIESPATALVALPSPFGPLPRRLVEDGAPAPDRVQLAERALQDPSWLGQLVSHDGRTGAIALDLRASDSDTARDAYAALDRALAPFEADGFRFHRVGGPVEFVVAGGELERATARMVPVMVVLVGLALLVAFRSPLAALLTLATVGVAVLWTLGLQGWLGFAQNSLTQVLSPLVLVIGVCDGVHLVSRYAGDGARLPRRSRSDTVRASRSLRLGRAAAEVARPCLMTSLTTAAGFASFATAELESFVRFGALAAFGVMAALVLCFSMLPLLLRFMDPDALRLRRGSARWEEGLATLQRFVVRRAGALVAASLVLGGVGSFGMTQLRVDASFEELYGEESRVVRWVAFVREHLRRPDTLEIELSLPEGAALGARESLDAIARTGRRLESIESLGSARSVVEPLAWQRRLLHGGRPGEQRHADERDENEALLALVEAFGAGVGEDGLARWVDPERRRVRISIESEKTPQDELRRVIAQIEQHLDHELPPGWTGLATGPLVLVHDMIEAIRTTQLRSFAAAGAAVLLLVALFLRSVRWALLAMVTTTLPVVVTLGAMGLLDIPLDVGTAMVAAAVVGIAVDDTIYLLEGFRRRRLQGAAPADAVAGAVAHVGRALVTTSFALAIGFSALTLSPWKSVASFGAVSAIAIVAALAAALVTLPALVLWVSPSSRGGTAAQIEGDR